MRLDQGLAGHTRRDEDEVVLGAVQRLAATLDQDPPRSSAAPCCRKAGTRSCSAPWRKRATSAGRPSRDRRFHAADAGHAAHVRGTPHHVSTPAQDRRHGDAALDGDARRAEVRAHRCVHPRHRRPRDERAQRPCHHRGAGHRLPRRRSRPAPPRRRRKRRGSTEARNGRARSCSIRCCCSAIRRSRSTPIASTTTCPTRASRRAIRPS